MQPARNILSENVRAQSVELLNKHMAAAINLQAQMKLEHWNVREPGFIAIHELFGQVSMVIKNYSDLLAERADGRGGAAPGAFQIAAKQSFFVLNPLDFADEHRHVFAVCGKLAEFGQSLQEAIDQAINLGDTETADLFAEISRSIDNQLWLVESYIAPKPSKPPRSQPPRQTRANGSQPARATKRVSNRLSTSANVRHAAEELREHIETWGNEGGPRREANR